MLALAALDGPWLEILEEAGRTLGMARLVRLLTSDANEAPLTGGWLRPAVLLPAVAESWTADRRRLVLQHELVHIVRGSIHWPGSRSDRPGWSANRPTRPWFDSRRSRRSTPASWWKSQRRCAAVRRSSQAPCLWSS